LFVYTAYIEVVGAGDTSMPGNAGWQSSPYTNPGYSTNQQQYGAGSAYPGATTVQMIDETPAPTGDWAANSFSEKNIRMAFIRKV